LDKIYEMKMNKLIFIILIISIASCAKDYDYDYRIKYFSHQELTYEKLPKRVKMLYRAVSLGGMDMKNLLFVDSADISTFDFEAIETIAGPWIAYYKLIDNKKQISYRIEYSFPFPYIIYHNKLYVPDKKNLYYCKEEIFEINCMEYTLK